jgi:hypothetical protein
MENRMNPRSCEVTGKEILRPHRTKIRMKFCRRRIPERSSVEESAHGFCGVHPSLGVGHASYPWPILLFLEAFKKGVSLIIGL